MDTWKGTIPGLFPVEDKAGIGTQEPVPIVRVRIGNVVLGLPEQRMTIGEQIEQQHRKRMKVGIGRRAASRRTNSGAMKK